MNLNFKSPFFVIVGFALIGFIVFGSFKLDILSFSNQVDFLGSNVTVYNNTISLANKFNSNLNAFYMFDGCSLSDFSGYGNTLANDGAICGSGYSGSGFTKNLGSGYLDTGITTFGSKGFTISFWLNRLVDTGSIEEILDKGNAGNSYVEPFAIQVSASDQIVLTMGGSGTTYSQLFSTTSIPLNQWHFYTFTWDGTNNINSMKLFVDGALNSQGTFAGVYQSNAYSILIFAYIFGGVLYQRGQFDIDDVRISNHVLSATDVSNLYGGFNNYFSLGSVSLSSFSLSNGSALQYCVLNGSQIIPSSTFLSYYVNGRAVDLGKQFVYNGSNNFNVSLSLITSDLLQTPKVSNLVFACSNTSVVVAPLIPTLNVVSTNSNEWYNNAIYLSVMNSKHKQSSNVLTNSRSKVVNFFDWIFALFRSISFTSNLYNVTNSTEGLNG